MDALLVKRKPWRALALAFLVSLALTLAWQWRGKAYRSEWSGDPDEAAHYVTGLMVHDYVAQGMPGPPMAYAKRYYDFYPKVAMGHWPPMFYVIQAAWTLIFTPSRMSLLILMATVSALWLTASYAVVALFFPGWMAWTAMVFLSMTSDFQRSSRMVMAEMTVALLTLLALGYLARYLDHPGEHPDWPDALGFSAASLAVVLTKGTGIALAPMAFLGAAAGRRWGILQSATLWVPTLLAASFAAVWFLTAPEALHQKVASLGGLGSFRYWRIPDTFSHWTQSLGVGGSAFAAVGYLRKAWGVAGGMEQRGWWIATVLFLPVTLMCRVLYGPWETKHLLTTLPLLMLCVFDGFCWILDKAPRWRIGITAVALVALGVTAVHGVANVPAKLNLGLDQVARDLLSDPQFAKDRFLILSDATGEGVFIAEVAANEHRPGHIIERGSKVLAEESFMGDRIRPLFTTPEELMRFCEQTPDRVIIVDGLGTEVPFLGLVRETIRRNPTRWQHIGTYTREGAALPLEVLRLNHG